MTAARPASQAGLRTSRSSTAGSNARPGASRAAALCWITAATAKQQLAASASTTASGCPAPVTAPRARLKSVRTGPAKYALYEAHGWLPPSW